MFTNRRENSLATSRERQPRAPGKPFRIFTPDGGGIRGIYAAELLRRCEERFCDAEPLARYFHMIAGNFHRRHHCAGAWSRDFDR